MEALPKALDPLFDSNTIPDSSDFFGFLVPTINKTIRNMLVLWGRGGDRSRVLGNHGLVIQENMCTDLLGPFLRPQEAPGGPK